MLASFVMPVKDGEKFIEKTVQSILNQSHKDIEIIAVNDHSADDTLGILNKIATKNTNIRVVSLTDKTGIGAGRNLGTKNAKGDVIFPIDADDPSSPNRVELSLKELENKNADIFYGNVERFFVDTGKRELRHFQPYDEKMLRNINFIAHGASAYKKEVFEQVGPYDENLKIGEDYDFFLKAQEKGFKFCFKNTAVSQYTMHPGQITTAGPEKIAERQKWNRLIREKHGIHGIDLEYVKKHATPEIIDFYINKNFDIWFSKESIPTK